MTEFDGRVAGAGRLGAVPLTASEPTHDPKAGVRHMPVSAEPAHSATAVSDDEAEARAAIAARLDRDGDGVVDYYPNDAAFWALAALSDAGFDIVKRPIGPESAASS